MRTTVDLDPLILAQLKARQLVEGKSLGELVSELLAPALRSPVAPPAEFRWPSRSMQPLVDLDDKDAVWAAMEQS